ncbi:ketoacyl-ACP synthase III family protein [Streptomyces sp. NPDC052396]|uniref:ketoacyl-ACP synthase III family protein n=1 Tax=Streptomyces sp. NPDC052396 TaxID=3365689 RepID=UPI0037CDC331
MRWENVYVAGLGTCLAEPTSITSAVEAGLVDRGLGQALTDVYDYLSVIIAEDVAPPDMAVHAAQAALKDSGLAPSDFSLLLHGSTWFQGLDIWPAASYVAQRTLGPKVPAMDVQQRCNIGVSALDLAAAHLTSGQGDAVLISIADRFCGPGADRWRLRHGTVYGDGAAAAVISRTGGFARLLTTATLADNSLEALARGDEPFRTSPREATDIIDLALRSDAGATRFEESEAVLRTFRLMQRVVRKALSEAGLGIDDVHKLVVPANGRGENGHHVFELLGFERERTTWEYARRTGHIGAGDWFAGLAHLVETEAVSPGDRVVLWSAGAGFTATAAVLEITDRLAEK